MADQPKDSTKVEDDKNFLKTNGGSASSLAAAVDEDVLLSLEDLDSVISNDDPDFSEVINGIGPNSEMLASGIDGFGLEYTLADEQALWKYSGGIRTLLYKIFPPIALIFFKLRQLRIKFKERIIYYQAVVKLAGLTLWKWLIKQVKQLKAGLSQAIKAFGKFSLVRKLIFAGFLVLLGLTAFVVYRSATNGLFPEPEELFMGSMREWSQKVYTFDPATETEAFFESTHSSQNMMVLPKMVVNLRRSASSGPNPMGAFEFFIEGSVSEVVVEVKDREAEVTDLFQRSLEEMNFDQVSSGEGKQLLTEKLRKEVNRILTKGKARRIFIKTAIIKP